MITLTGKAANFQSKHWYKTCLVKSIFKFCLSILKLYLAYKKKKSNTNVDNKCILKTADSFFVNRPKQEMLQYNIFVFVSDHLIFAAKKCIHLFIPDLFMFVFCCCCGCHKANTISDPKQSNGHP